MDYSIFEAHVKHFGVKSAAKLQTGKKASSVKIAARRNPRQLYELEEKVLSRKRSHLEEKSWRSGWETPDRSWKKSATGAQMLPI